MPSDDLTVVDNRTGQSYTIPISEGSIRAIELRQIRTSADDFGLLSYDPSFENTASCRSSITFIDGDQGILRYRGYPIEELAEKSSYLEVAYLLSHNDLPTKSQLNEWGESIVSEALVTKVLQRLMDGFDQEGHPMAMLLSAMGAMATHLPDAKNVGEEAGRMVQTVRAIGKVPTLAAMTHRRKTGQSFVEPDQTLSYTGNFLRMLFDDGKGKYTPNPVIERALDILFILHADHEQNCSSNAMRSIGSSQPDPYSALSGAIAALYGPLHGGANEAAVGMLEEIGSKDKVPEFVAKAKAGEARLMGFGHRVYKNYDPRARIIRQVAEEVFEVTGRNPLIDVAIELERIALEDDYFVSRKLYPNVDYYSGIIYQAIGFSKEMYPVLFAIPRTAGWMAQWMEMLGDKEQRIARPRQLYIGEEQRPYVPLGKRQQP
ncbi:citrate synthase [Dehalococcoidia bacterium]|nr:citrate synthase [Dehalococcoidia bacterium]